MNILNMNIQNDCHQWLSLKYRYFVFVIINSSKHVQTYGKSHYQHFARCVVTQTVLGGLIIYPPVANFL